MEGLITLSQEENHQCYENSEEGIKKMVKEGVDVQARSQLQSQ